MPAGHLFVLLFFVELHFLSSAHAGPVSPNPNDVGILSTESRQQIVVKNSPPFNPPRNVQKQQFGDGNSVVTRQLFLGREISLKQRHSSITSVVSVHSELNGKSESKSHHRRRHSSIGEWVGTSIGGVHDRWRDSFEQMKLKGAVVRAMLTTSKRVEEMLKVLMYMSRMDSGEEAIIIGMRTLKSLSNNYYLVERLMQFSAKEVGLSELQDLDGTDTLMIKFSIDGIFPVYFGGEKPNEWGTFEDDALLNGWYQSPDSNGTPVEIQKEETEQAELLLEEISLAVRENAGRPLHVIFEAALSKLSLNGNVREKLRARVENWKRKWAEIKESVHKHTVREDLKDLIMWLLSPLHMEMALELTLMLTGMSSAIEVPRAVMSLLGVDDLLSDSLAKMGTLLKKRYDNKFVEIMAKYFLDENSISYLFLHEGQPAEAKFIRAEKKVFRLTEEEALELMKAVTETVVEERGKTKGHMVEKTLVKLKHWKHDFVREAQERWNSLKRMDMSFLRTDMESLKYALRNQRWLTTERVFTVLDVILQMTKMNGSIAVAHDAMKILGLENKVFDWVDEKAANVLKKHLLKTAKKRSGQNPYVVKFVVAGKGNNPNSNTARGTKSPEKEKNAGKWVQIPIHGGSDEEGEEEEEDDGLGMPKWTVLVHKGADGQFYGVLEPIRPSEFRTGWTLVDDLHSGYLLLKTAINTIRGNPSLELDHLVKIAYREYGTSDRFGLREDIYSTVIACFPFFGSSAQKFAVETKWQRIEIEEMRNIRQVKQFKQQKNRMNKLIERQREVTVKNKKEVESLSGTTPASVALLSTTANIQQLVNKNDDAENERRKNPGESVGKKEEDESPNAAEDEENDKKKKQSPGKSLWKKIRISFTQNESTSTRISHYESRAFPRLGMQIL